MLFQLVPGGLSDPKKQNNYSSNWKKILGFRNLQEKLEKDAVVITFKAVEGNSIEKTCQKASCGLVQQPNYQKQWK